MKTDTKVQRFDAYHVLPDSPQVQRDFLYVIASLAARISDPLGRDIVRVAELNAIKPLHVDGFQEFPKRGFGGLVKAPDEPRPRAVVVGTREFISEAGLEIPAILEASARQWEKKNLVWLAGWDGTVHGILRFIGQS